MKLFQPLREQIDACREGNGDLALPALAELASAVRTDQAVVEQLDRAQQFDRCVRAALNDAPVPEGLAERLITAIRSEQDRSVVQLPTSDAPRRTFALRQIRLSRRQMLWAGGGVALVALLAVGVSQIGWSQRTVAQHELAGDVGKLLGKLGPKAWRPLDGGALPKGIVLDSAILAKPVQVQDVVYQSDAGWSANVTAINIAPAGRPKAILFVVRSSVRFAVPSVPTTTTRLGLSRGFSATAWQRLPAGPLYVLVVEEDRGQRLDEYLSKAREA
jgi:hypothetical protein